MEVQEAYRRCLLIRRFEETLGKLKQAGRIHGSLHLCSGQEACAVGGCAALLPVDRLVCTYRGHGWVIAKGVPLNELYSELMGRDSPLCGGRGGSAYLSAPKSGVIGENSIVGGGVPIAAGSALRSQRMPDGAVTLCVIGDGALNQGAVHEALNFAAVMKLPLVVFVENNGYAELTPTYDMFPIRELSERAASYGMPSTVVDGNDVNAVEHATKTAVEAARSGGGPWFIEAVTHRLSGHYDLDPQQYRPQGELEQAREAEPLARLARELNDELVVEIENEVQAELEAAVSAAEQDPFPSLEEARSHLYE